MKYEIKNINLIQLAQFSAFISKLIKSEFFIILAGNIGAGKTTFAKMLIKNLGYDGNVNSPSFIIANKYFNHKNQIINHFDFYRLNKKNNIEMFIEMFDNAINIIEWIEKVNFNYLKEKYIKIKLINSGVYNNKEVRNIIIETNIRKIKNQLKEFYNLK